MTDDEAKIFFLLGIILVALGISAAAIGSYYYGLIMVLSGAVCCIPYIVGSTEK